MAGRNVPAILPGKSPAWPRGALPIFYLATIGLLPWTWFPPFPWLHEHAQWSDALMALTTSAWALDRWHRHAAWRPASAHWAMGAYLAAAALSLLLAAPNRLTGSLKLLGMVELLMLAIVTADMAGRPGLLPALARVVAANAVLIAGVAVAGMVLFALGVPTRLVGPYGSELIPGPYARIQAGFYHPNLLASYCIFAAAVLARTDGALPAGLRRLTLVALSVTVILTVSRGILGFGLFLLLQAGRTRQSRRIVGLYAAAAIIAVASLTLFKVEVDPTRPWAARLSPGPSPRWETITSSFSSFRTHPVWGTGLETHTGRMKGQPADAHLTPLNIAATLGLPALLAFISIPAALWWRRRRPMDLATWGGLAALGLDSLGQDIEDFRHLWVLFGLAEERGERTTAATGRESRG